MAHNCIATAAEKSSIIVIQLQCIDASLVPLFLGVAHHKGNLREERSFK